MAALFRGSGREAVHSEVPVVPVLDYRSVVEVEYKLDETKEYELNRLRSE